MKFFSMIIDIPKGQYVITDKPAVWQSIAKVLAILFKILAIVCLSLWSGFEHMRYVIGRQLGQQLETLAVNLLTSLLAPKGRVALC